MSSIKLLLFLAMLFINTLSLNVTPSSDECCEKTLEMLELPSWDNMNEEFVLLSNNTLSFNVISNSDCEPCKERLEFVIDLFSGGEFIVHELSKTGNIERFQEVTRIVEEDFLPLPLFIIFEGDELRAVVAGGQSTEIWVAIDEETVEGVPIYADDVLGKSELKKIIRDEERIHTLEDLFINTTIKSTRESFFSLIMPVSISALIDAFNPCSISVLLVLLTFVFYNLGRKVALKTGLAFCSAVFVTYYSIGLGILQTFKYFSYSKYVVITLGVSLGILKIIEFFTGEKRYLPSIFVKKITTYLERVANPRTGFVAGVISASLLMPCSSAPYFLALNLLSESTTQLDGLLLLGIYNIIIILPFLIITISVQMLGVKTMDMKLWMFGNRRWINLVLGIALICLSVFIFYQ